ncbi:phage portal protein [Bacillus thuringiensis serovar israelensis]|uniref:Phage portal protein n=2 Tax=Bacillus thuringiensis TaxID=1428 RepID=A0A9Q5X4S4_BACTU|nr:MULTISPECIES: phage portal protein [Bacillus cereus group]EEM58658.1 Phage portal protein, SPP1 [Bacillus thuringiensis serovar monterrey BGSC 4AJ1]MEB9670962.1 phage portal protein [Bacillus anthracis]OTW45007.1 phage portal protein [Bacillus thuringiensis serovar mexicanensis]OTW73629.1 phage portal protein [Bacillus thuringiensis serovar coreanensis]OTX01638.1 phage portal protein [Bacillus thuringiensis serovar monterrey]
MFEHYIPLLDENNGEPTPKLLKKIIDEFEPVKQRMINRFERYKASEKGVPIFTREFKGDGNKDKVNNKLNNDFFSEIIDTKIGYMFGLPISYSLDHEDEEVLKRIQDFLKANHTEDADAETGKFASICGYGARLLYHDKEGIEKVMNIKPYEAIFLTNSSIAEPKYAIRCYPIKVIDGDDFKDGYKVEFYNDTQIIEYTGEDLDKLKETNRITNLYKGVPLIGFPNNEELQGDVDKALSLIEGYDRTLSDVNSEVEQFRLAYMMFQGVEVDEETVENLKKTGALQLPEGANAFFLTKDLNDNILEHHLDRLEKNICRFTKHVNLSDESFGGNLTGVAIRYKLLALETKSGTLEVKFTKSLRQQFKLLFDAWNLRSNKEELDYLCMTFQFTRNIPVNLADEAEVQAKLQGLISEETRLSLFSAIHDPKSELQKMKEEEADSIDLDAVNEGGENIGMGQEAETPPKDRGRAGKGDSLPV